jgi:hypothetical protein
VIPVPKPAEWRILELAALGLSDDNERAEFESLADRHDLHWGEVLDQAIRHKLLHLLGYHITEETHCTSVPPMLSEHMRETLRVSRQRVSLFRQAAADIAATLHDRGARVACTKGIVLESTLYGGRGARPLGDMDFMVSADDGRTVTAVMSEMGFLNGYLDRATGTIESFTRQDLIGYHLNPDHLPPFIKNLNDPVTPHVHVDFACSFTWTNCPYQVPLSEGLKEIAQVELPATSGRTIPALNTQYLFIFTVLHLFREAYVSKWIDLSQDVNLMKFGDVIRSWRKWRNELDTDAFRLLLRVLQIEQPMGWVLVHADRTFDTTMASALGLHRQVSEEFLSSGGSRAGRQIRWRGTMLERLQTKNRKDLLVNESAASAV